VPWHPGDLHGAERDVRRVLRVAAEAGPGECHRDHVSYYSYTTIKVLLERAGYSIVEHYWYGGKPYISEGLIVKAVPGKG